MSKMLEFDEEVFRAHFHSRPFYVRHALAEHPLFQWDRLLKLARTLPSGYLEWRGHNTRPGLTPEEIPDNGLDAQTTIQNLAANGSYFIMKWVEHDPEYRALLDQIMDEIRPLTDASAPGMHKRAAFIFISNPKDVAAFHIDHEHNFLLQVRGSKVVRQWDPNDRWILPDLEIERHYAGEAHRNIEWKDSFAATAWTLPMKAGEGVHFPVCAPHYIQVGPELSVSFSVTFRSRWTRRRELLYHANAHLRKLGFRPAPPGERKLEDLLKLGVIRAVGAFRKVGRAGAERGY